MSDIKRLRYNSSYPRQWIIAVLNKYGVTFSVIQKTTYLTTSGYRRALLANYVLINKSDLFTRRDFRTAVRKSLALWRWKEYNKVNVCSRRSKDMAISYNKLWKLLVDKKMSKADLRKAAGIAPNTMTRLRRDEEVTLSVLNKICKILEVDIGDIMEFLPEQVIQD